MRVTIYQPQYFPRLHYFNRLFDSDMFIVLDSAQYTKSLVHEGETRERHKSYQSDTPIFDLNHGQTFLTVPIENDGLCALRNTHVKYDGRWQRKHLAVVTNTYGKSRYYSRYFPEIQSLLANVYSSLAELNIATILWGVTRILGIGMSVEELSIEEVNAHLMSRTDARLRKIVLDSQIGVKRPDGRQKGTEWTVALCKHVGATEYMYGGTARDGYMDLRRYIKCGITPIMQDWSLEPYEQPTVQDTGFVADLSVIDLLMSVGSRGASRRLVTGCKLEAGAEGAE